MEMFNAEYLISVIFSSFQVPINEQMSTEVIRSERDAWVTAINKLCVDWKHKSQSEHVYEELRLSTIIAKTIIECQSESETEPETDRVQINHESVLVPPLPRPRASAGNVSVPLPGAVLEPVCLPALGPEQVPELKLSSTPVKTPEPEPEPEPVAQLAAITPLVSTSALIPAPPMPPPPPMKGKPKPVTERTKAFHWDVVTQDKVLYLQYSTKVSTAKMLYEMD